MESGTVALFIDWENIKISTVEYLKSPPDIIILKKIARKYGRLKLAKAYANWADMEHEGDMERFSFQNMEPVFVQTRRYYQKQTKKQTVKGTADIRLACDCVELLLQNDNIDTFVLATGDAGFEHVVNKINARGKRAVMIGIRGSTGKRLGVVSDDVVWYDDWISGLKIGASDRRVQDALVEFQRAVEDCRRDGRNNNLQAIKQAMQKKDATFEEENIGLPTFRHLANLAEMKRLVRIDSSVMPAKAYLSDEKMSDEGTALHSGVKWGKLIKAMEPNTPYNSASLNKIIKDHTIYVEEKDIQSFIYNATLSGVLWFKSVRYHNPNMGAVRGGRNFYLDLTNPKVQVYITEPDSQPTDKAKVIKQ